MGSFTVSITLL